MTGGLGILGFAGAIVLGACTYPVEYACDETHPCLPRYPDRPFCDLEGIYPGSEGIGRTCVPNPFDAGLLDGAVADDGGVIDASAMLDAMFDAASTDAGPPIGPSCNGMQPTCGAAGNDSCCASSVVPGGSFYRVYDVATDGYNDMSYPATVSTFRLDTYEITVARFRAFVLAGKGTQQSPPDDGSGAHPWIAGSGWKGAWNVNLEASTAALLQKLECEPTYQTWSLSSGPNDNKPINCISWYEAFAFCIWDGGFLPTQAEWNYAAAGGNEQRAYPWSNPAGSTVIDSSYAVYEENVVAEVGSRSPKNDGRWGHSDLGGNLGEWVLDYSNSGIYPVPCFDCAELTETEFRIRQNSSFLNGASGLRVAYARGVAPNGRGPQYGARCARAP